MRICFVGPANNPHMVKWCTWFYKKGHEIHVISFTEGNIANVSVHFIDTGVDVEGRDVKKLKYLFTGKKISRIIKRIKPDIVNVHYATSYGMAMALSGYSNYILSMWGSDIYDFPQKSMLHKWMLMYSLKKAKILFSTSQAMADEASKYTKKKIIITPFGVDMELFHPKKRTRSADGKFVVGTVKGLSDKYGIKDILQAVATVHKKGEIPIRLRIAGKGPQEQEYHLLSKQLGIDKITTWLGFISQEEAATEWANMDVAIIPSTLESESFGVSAVEAQACATVVVISDIPGLMEATKPGTTSIVVDRNHPEQIASNIEKLYYDTDRRIEYAKAGRDYVLLHYELDACFSKIEKMFERYCKRINAINL